MSRKIATSVVHVCGSHTHGEIELNKALQGKKVTNLFGGRSHLTALSENGVIDIIHDRPITSNRVAGLSFGKHHCMSLLPNGSLYSWGSGDFGELGLGSKTLACDVPTQITLTGNIVDISCGDYHSCAVDDKGNIYSWGQNFDRQLGLYEKTKDQMTMYKNCYIEDIVLCPRFLPFSAKSHVTKVACGARFTAAVTTTGDVWTWGGGECGQLGTGRCTRKEVASCCYRGSGTALEENDSAKVHGSPIVDITCGFSHVLALTKDGNMYSWGINKQGQLGLGDDVTRQYPTMILQDSFKTAILSFQASEPDDFKRNNIITSTEADQFHIVKVYSDVHSSAAIDSAGRLYTWGSGANYRTMLAHDKVVKAPILVSRLGLNEVHSFAFCEKASAVLVISKLSSVYPLQGPVKSFHSLTLKGCGFYPSDDIVVKFSRTGVAFVPPRSSLGKYMKDGVVVCRPPKFSEGGEYEVSLALNGVDFVAETMTIMIYPEPSLVSVAPLLNDARTILADKNGILNINMVGINVEPLHRTDIFVKFSIKSTEMLFAKNSTEGCREVVVMGTVTKRVVENFASDENEEDYENEEDGSVGLSRGDGSVPGTANGNKDDVNVEYYINCSISLSEIAGKEIDEECVGDMLTTMRASVSLNEEDYCNAPPDNVIVHTYTPTKAFPPCLPMDSPTSTVRVLGSSLLPSNLIETEAIVSIVGATSLNGAKVTLPPSYLEFTMPCPVSCRAASELNFMFPKLKQVLVSAVLSRPPSPGASVTSAAGSTISRSSSRESSQPSKKGKAVATPEESVNSFLNGIATLDIAVTFRLSMSSASISLADADIVGIEMDTTPLTDVSLPLTLYKETPIKISPMIFRRVISGVCTNPPPAETDPDAESVVEEDPMAIPDSTNPAFTIRSDSQVFYTETAKIIFTDDGRDLKETVDATMERRPKEVEAVGTKTEIMELTCKCPNLYFDLLNEEDGNQVPVTELRNGPLEYVNVVLLLDGESVPDESCQVKIPIFDGLSNIEMSSHSQGHHATGSSVKLTAEGIVKSQCIIRISGPEFGKYVEVTGETRPDDKEIIFTIPESVNDSHRVEPHMKGKDKLFFISISLDGGLYFDRSTEAILHVK